MGPAGSYGFSYFNTRIETQLMSRQVAERPHLAVHLQHLLSRKLRSPLLACEHTKPSKSPGLKERKKRRTAAAAAVLNFEHPPCGQDTTETVPGALAHEPKTFQEL